MGFDINTFKAQGLPYDGARPALFSVQLTAPPVLGLDATSIATFSFRCRAAQLPAASNPAMQVPYFGRFTKHATFKQFDPWQISVMEDEGYEVRALFEKWSNLLNSMESNVRGASLDNQDYKALFEITQFGKDEEPLRSYQMIGAWPETVGGIQMAWNDTNDIVTFPVTVQYDYWIPNIETNSKSGVNTYGDQT